MSFFNFVLEGKWPFSDLQVPIYTVSFSKKMNTIINDTKTSKLAKSAKEKGNICDHLWHLSGHG